MKRVFASFYLVATLPADVQSFLRHPAPFLRMVHSMHKALLSMSYRRRCISALA
jgi:hypothetical protein